MRIRLEQLNPTIGDLLGNKELILSAIEKAEADGIELLLLPELITSGYPPMDLLEREIFRELIFEMNQEIVEATGDTAVVFGTITPNHTGIGRKCYNSAIVAQHGEVIKHIHKALLPTYDVFDDLRYFEPGKEFDPVVINGFPFGITVCEDIWFNDNDIQYHIYDVNPAEVLKDKGARAIINISASPFNKQKPVTRKNMLQNHADQLGIPLFYVNQVGAQTELIFDGDSLAFDGHGHMNVRAKRFEPDAVDLDFIPEKKEVNPITDVDANLQTPPIEQVIFEGLVRGVRDYLQKSGAAEKVLLGLSGGIDSALTCVVAKEALGADNVKAVTMPSEFSSEGSVSDSEKLARNLGVELLEIPIRDIYESFNSALAPHFEGTNFGVAEENLQSRSRGVLLMALANKFGYMLLNTGNKSEMAVGYCTLYGDMAGGLSVISDVYKTEVFDICRWLNEEYYGEEIIPEAIITKPPSAELRPDQKDTDSLPAYEILDQILKNYIEDQKSREEIIALGIDEAVVDQVLRLVDVNEHKRFQAPPGLKVSAKAFGSGRRWPIVQQWTGQEKKILQSEKISKSGR
ncbi:NAD+ synthase [Gracilimonas mengyeensis]|uniref:Glutamine-dependent NAD(+) synthetase n=1 Tax=Gracilimonas mengyeensis TaxID=1302730 RepID=A0A521EQB6_9BACT|nr:NAD+ synthase [Gracilimonas mengyeensis]SMO86116.1 NAD+ synthase/NAD+ synthase (glutamine-hydrolysing) [Gracilimonas mengyeensis]